MLIWWRSECTKILRSLGARHRGRRDYIERAGAELNPGTPGEPGASAGQSPASNAVRDLPAQPRTVLPGKRRRERRRMHDRFSLSEANAHL